ncbi:MAG: hypothetical protein HY271_14760 [Deltaproteobacteria bacterium]|nr:hypothetical protein [Deltaproteobacteria bacterium]
MMRRGALLTAFTLVVPGGLLVPGAAVGATTVNTCLTRKLSHVGQSLARRAICYAKDAARPSRLLKKSPPGDC